jgi:hypothetical protein
MTKDWCNIKIPYVEPECSYSAYQVCYLFIVNWCTVFREILEMLVKQWAPLLYYIASSISNKTGILETCHTLGSSVASSKSIIRMCWDICSMITWTLQCGCKQQIIITIMKRLSTYFICGTNSSHIGMRKYR